MEVNMVKRGSKVRMVEAIKTLNPQWGPNSQGEGGFFGVLTVKAPDHSEDGRLGFRWLVESEAGDLLPVPAGALVEA